MVAVISLWLSVGEEMLLRRNGWGQKIRRAKKGSGEEVQRLKCATLFPTKVEGRRRDHKSLKCPNGFVRKQ